MSPSPPFTHFPAASNETRWSFVSRILKERERETEKNGAAAAGKDASLTSKYSPPPRYVKLTGITDLHECLVEGFNRTPTLSTAGDSAHASRHDSAH